MLILIEKGVTIKKKNAALKGYKKSPLGNLFSQEVKNHYNQLVTITITYKVKRLKSVASFAIILHPRRLSLRHRDSHSHTHRRAEGSLSRSTRSMS